VGICVEKRDSFCCYESPLSRILNEQIKDQLGLSWGSPEEPLCGGIPLTTLPNVDWSRINLDEWIGILTLTGHMPTVGSDKLSAAGLTGGGSYLDVNGTRVDYVERATSKIEGASLPDVNEVLRQQLYGN
jgi:conjugal transfer mating pair stabilization protein TraN